MVAIAANYLDNFFSSKSNAFIVAFLMMLGSWSLSLTSVSHLGLALSSACVVFLLFVLLKVTSASQASSEYRVSHSAVQEPSLSEASLATDSISTAVSEASDILSVTSTNIGDIFSTQSDAVATLSESFISLQTLLGQQESSINNLLKDDDNSDCAYADKMRSFASETDATLTQF